MQKGMLNWVLDPATAQFALGTVVMLNPKKKTALVELEGGRQIEVDSGLLFQRSVQIPPPDLSKLTFLNTAQIIHVLRSRFLQGKQYSSIGNILVSINPYHWKSQQTHLRQNISRLNEAAGHRAPFPIQEAEPHVFAVTGWVKLRLLQEGTNQTVVVRGESGAGKTEASRLVLQFLAASESEHTRIHQQILSLGLILQSFGNSRTLRNHNSSRFGKYTRIFYQKGKLAGACLEQYLLQKTRVTTFAPGEKTYHVFYYLAAAQNIPYSRFALLGKSDLGDRHQQHASHYKNIVSSLSLVGFSKQQTEGVRRLLLAILHLGNVGFDEASKSDSLPCTITCHESLKEAAFCLGLSAEALANLLIFRLIDVAGSIILSPESAVGCANNRHSLCRSLYNQLFEWLVQGMNVGLRPKRQCQNFIGLLDIFGFECFDNNSLEQLCINFANQKIQQIYTELLFKAQSVQLAKEGIPLQLTFVDNSPLVSLFEAPPRCIFDILTDSCRMSGQDDQAFLLKLFKGCDKNYALSRGKSNLNFIIQHSARDVQYSALEFRSKNMDDIGENAKRVLKTAELRLIGKFFEERDRGRFLVSRFRTQLKQLVQELKQTSISFIKCIKPNNCFGAWLIQPFLLLQQVKYLGILDAVKIRAVGFPVRLSFAELSNRYRLLLSPSVKFRQFWDKLSNLCGISSQSFAIGTSKLFLKNKAFQALQQLNLRMTQQLRKSVRTIIRARRKIILKRNISRIIRLRKRMNLFMSKLQVLMNQLKRSGLLGLKDNLLRKHNMKLCFRQQSDSNQAYNIYPQVKHSLRERQLIHNSLCSGGNIDYGGGKERQQLLLAKAREQKQRSLVINQSVAPMKSDDEVKCWKRGVGLADAQEEDLLESGRDGLIWRRGTQLQQQESELNELLLKEDKDNMCFELQEMPRKLLPMGSYQQRFISSVEENDYRQYLRMKLNPSWIKIFKEESLEKVVCKLLTFTKSTINEPVTDTKGYFRKEMTVAFSILLKILGEKGSRLTFQENMHSLFLIMNGRISNNDTGAVTDMLTEAQAIKARDAAKSEQDQFQTYRSVLGKQQQSAPQSQYNEAKSYVTLTKSFQKMSNNLLYLIRDQVYFQVLKQLHDCKKPKLEETLAKLLSLLSEHFSPSYDAVYPLLNFILTYAESSPHSQFFYATFQNLAKFAEAYEILMNKGQLLRLNAVPRTILVFKNNEHLEREDKLELCKDMLERLEGRSIFDPDQLKLMEAPLQKGIRVNLFTGSHVLLSVESAQTVRKLSSRVARLTGLESRARYMSLFLLEQVYCELNDWLLLGNSTRVLQELKLRRRLTASQFAKHRRNKKFFLYFGIKYYFKLSKRDQNGVRIYYSQLKFQFSQALFPFEKQSTFKLMALCFYRMNGPSNKDNESHLRKQISKLIPTMMVGLLCPEEWFQGCLKAYRLIDLCSLGQVQYQFIKELRRSYFFACHQFNAFMFKLSQERKDRKMVFQKDEGRMVVLGVRPYHIVIANKDRQDPQLICYEDISSWGLGEQKKTTLILNIRMEDYRLLVFDGAERAEDLLNGYVNLSLGHQLDEKSALISQRVVTMSSPRALK